LRHPAILRKTVNRPLGVMALLVLPSDVNSFPLPDETGKVFTTWPELSTTDNRARLRSISTCAYPLSRGARRGGSALAWATCPPNATRLSNATVTRFETLRQRLRATCDFPPAIVRRVVACFHVAAILEPSFCQVEITGRCVTINQRHESSVGALNSQQLNRIFCVEPICLSACPCRFGPG
jgi:hypothetical protein